MINRECINRSSKGVRSGSVEGVHPTRYSAYDVPPLQSRTLSSAVHVHNSHNACELGAARPLDATAERERDASFPAQALILLPAKCCEVPFGSESPKQA